MGLSIDWAGVLTGQPLHWLLWGLVVTLAITLAAGVIATVVAVALIAFTLSPVAPLRLATRALVSLVRNTPLLVQLLVWYFVGFGLLPGHLKFWMTSDHPWTVLPGQVSVFAPEFAASAWGVGLFIGVFLCEEIRAGLNAVGPGQREAAASQGLSRWDTLAAILLPQALRNAYQPVVGQYLNLMKLTAVTCSIGLAELTYQARQVESFNSHAFEAFAAATLLYLVVGFVLERILLIGRKA
ncbi:MAG: amino acid ABC transporter permease [Holophaga sp.]|nr:amino acid ABC transporter permease [Holophaga sp.]